MSPLTGCVQFVSDDAGYLRWLAQNPGGFVVNSERVPTSGYLKLHRATCETINNRTTRNWTTTGYIKTCSTQTSALAQWAQQTTGGVLQPCGSCRPASVTKAAPPRQPGPPPLPTPPPIPASVREASDPVTRRPRPTIPVTIASGCPELDEAWRRYASMIVSSHIAIPDTDEDLTWHAFLGHSIDMQGFRAAEFAGVDALTRPAPNFVPLKVRGLGVPQLASLWDIRPIREHLLRVSKEAPLDATLAVLRTSGGSAGASLADAFAAFPWRKFHWSVRALLQNSAVLRPFDFSFRRWLIHECASLGTAAFPPVDFRQPVSAAATRTTLEAALRQRLAQAFYMVGPAMSAYMLCDWQLWLWREGHTQVFANFKLDTFHEAFIKRFGRGIIPADETGFARWWLSCFPALPPRLANECIWLAVENKLVEVW